MSTGATTPENVLAVRELSYSYAQASREIISHLSFSVKRGEIVCILGASGCGKSTLLDLIAGLLAPTNGSVQVLSSETDQKSQRPIGYIFQQDALLPWRNVLDNMFLAADLNKKFDKSQARKNIGQYLTVFGLPEEVLSKHPSELSGGMRQRVSIIQSLLFDPQLILLDEPFSALDFFTKLKLESEFFNLIKNKRKAAVMVTHDIEEAIALADRIMLMDREGRFTQEFTIDLGEDRSTETARGTVKFADYYREIWSELKQVAEL